MKDLDLSDSSLEESLSNRNVATFDDSDYSLKVTVIYHDEFTRALASQALDRTAQSAGMDTFRCSWWSVANLLNFQVLDDAARAAIAADIIVVAVRAPGELPPGLCAWIDSWLPRRRQGGGVLLAIIGVPEESLSASAEARKFLGAVAHYAQLDFLVQVRLLPSVCPGALTEDAHKPPGSVLTASFAGANQDERPVYWGIND
ncbi:MAG: hypothetical protein ACLQVY_22240 [Limisphaerales bacterium]